MIWGINETGLKIPSVLSDAYWAGEARTSISRYRSRNNYDEDYIITAYSWLWLPRLDEDVLETVNRAPVLYYKTINLSRDDNPEAAAGYINSNIRERLYSRSNTHTMLTIFNSSCNKALEENLVALMKEKTEIPSEPVIELDVRTALTLDPGHRIHVYKYTESDSYWVITNRYTPELEFKLSAVLIRHNKMTTVPEVARNDLSNAYLTGTLSNVLAVINKLYEGFTEKLKEKRSLTMIDRIEINNRENMLRNKENEISDVEIQINNYNSRLRDTIQHLNSLRTQYLGLIASKQEDVGATLKEFLKNNRGIFKDIRVDKDEPHVLCLLFNTHLMYWNDSEYRILAESNLNNPISILSECKKALTDAIFLTKDVIVNIISGVRINLINGHIVYASRNTFTATSEETKFGMHNPHHRHYNCFGDYSRAIEMSVSERDYVAAIVQAQAAVAGINLADNAVLNRFIENDLFSSYYSKPCLILKETGEHISPKTYITRWEEKQHETNQTNQ